MVIRAVIIVYLRFVIAPEYETKQWQLQPFCHIKKHSRFWKLTCIEFNSSDFGCGKLV